MASIPADIDDEKFDDLDLEEAVSQLPERLRYIIKLYYLYEYTEAEIGDMLGVSGSMVSKEKRRAMLELREHFGCPSATRPSSSCPKNSTAKGVRWKGRKDSCPETKATCRIDRDTLDEFLPVFRGIAYQLCPADPNTREDIVSEMLIALMTHTTDEWNRALRIRRAKLCAIDWLRSKSHYYSWGNRFAHVSLEALIDEGWDVNTEGQFLRETC